MSWSGRRRRYTAKEKLAREDRSGEVSRPGYLRDRTLPEEVAVVAYALEHPREG
jgi:hypothetical protein